jgi:ethylbenzene dioxygenase subunit beta
MDPIRLEQMALWFEVDQFYTREARLLDAEDYDAWLATMTEDVGYWMPARETLFRKDEGEPDPARMNLYKESLVTLRVRTHRLKTNTAWSENPRTRYRHLITNVEVGAGAAPGEYAARSNFLIYRNRLERDEDWMVGTREDVLRRVDGELRLASRKILLDQNSLLSKNLNVYA